MGDINWLMVVTAAILIVAGMLGYINGLIKTILNLVLGIVTLVLVVLVSPRVCTFLQEQTPLPDYIQTKTEVIVIEQAEKKLQEGVSWEQLGAEAFVEELPFLPAMKDAVLESDLFHAQASLEIQQLASAVAGVIADKVIILIGYFSTFVVVFIALRIVAFVLDIIGRLPLINGINKMAGLAAGLAEGLVVVWILGIGLTLFSTTALGQSAAACVQESKFLSIVYGYNLLQELVFWMF